VKVLSEVFEESFETFRRCGADQQECVVYWSGPAEDGGLVDQVHHPDHQAGAGGYDVDGAWLTAFLRSLTAEQRKVRVQVHTHPGSTFHSRRDDTLALLYVPGFLSLVIPNFGLDEAALKGSYLAGLDASGQWQERDPLKEFEIR